MRNLKRALSLTLASVMLLGMMVVGSSAAAGYDDVSKTDNVEAIEVLQTIEVMVGDERGFGPERPVNRAEMAVVMGKLLNLDYNYYATSCPFNDVYDWARGYVGACYANKIVSGRGEGVYDPGATVTAVEAASMLMRALGYFQYANDVSDGFELSTVRQGTKIGIFDQVGSSATDPMTRNQVAQMVLNALKSGVVEPDGNTINLTTPDGTVFTGKVNYVYVTSQKDFAYAISNVGATSIGSQNSGAIVELGERLYNGDLKLSNYYADDFGRPARHWEYDGKDIGTYVKKELLKKEWTTKVTGRDLYDVLTKPTIDKYDFYISIDGETQQSVLNATGDSYYFNQGNLIRSNTEGVGGTGNGVLTQVYVDPNEGINGTVYISVINTYFAKATNNYDAKKDQVKLEIYAAEEVSPVIDGNTVTALVKNSDRADKESEKRDISGEDFNIENVKKDDIFLVNIADNEIKVISDVETVEGTSINLFKNGDYVNADGTRYDYSSAALYDWDVLDQYVKDNMKDTTYNLFLDEYGYMIGIEIVEKPTNYLFLAGIDLATSNLTKKTADGNVIFLDGTMATVKIDMDKSKNVKDGASGSDDPWEKNLNSEACATMNTWCTYTVSDDNVYTLIEVANSKFALEHADNTKELGQSHEVEDNTTASYTTNDGFIASTVRGSEIDKKHVATMGINSSSHQTVYGNEDSIYLTAEVDKLIATNAFKGESSHTLEAIVVSDVDSVVTGVQNANLKAWTAAKAVHEAGSSKATINDGSVSSGVYTLFDKDGYVIAAVVVGEDDGTSKGYAYVTSATGSNGMDSEGYDSNKYTWTREVVVDGEFTTLKEITDGANPEIESMDRGCWYEVKYKADGTVKSATKIDWDNNNTSVNDTTHGMEFFAYDNTHTNKFIGRMDIWENSMAAGNDLVVLSQDLTSASTMARALDPVARFNANETVSGSVKLSVDGNTLQIETSTGAKNGFSVAPSAKIVLVQDKQVKRNGADAAPVLMEYTYTYVNDNKATGLKDMLDDLVDNNNFVGFVSAVFDNGPATSVVIWDQTPEKIDAGDNTQTTTPVGGEHNKAVIDELNLELDVYYTDEAVRAPIKAALEAAGYTVASWGTVGSTSATVAATQTMTANKDGVPKTFTIRNLYHYVTVTLNGTNVEKIDTTTFTSLFASGDRDNDLYGKTTKLGGVAVPAGYVNTNTSTALKTGDVIWTNDLYLKVNAMPATATLNGLTDGANAAATAAVTYSVKGQTTAAGASATDSYVKVGDKLEITVTFGAGNKLTVRAAGDAKLSAGTVDTDTGYVAAVKTAATLGTDAVAETVDDNTVTFPTASKTYTAGVYTFTKTVDQDDIDAKTDLTVETMALDNA